MPMVWLPRPYSDAASLPVELSPPSRYGPLRDSMKTYTMHGMETTVAAVHTPWYDSSDS